MSYKSIHGIMHNQKEISAAINVISTHKTVPTKYRKFLLKYYAIETTYGNLLHTADLLKKIVHQDVIYQLVFDSHLHSVSNDTMLVLSFRQTKHTLGTDNFCIVSAKE